MRILVLLISILVISSLSHASDVNYQNIVGHYRIDVSGKFLFKKYNFSFNAVIYPDQTMTLQKIREDGIQARICVGHFELVNNSNSENDGVSIRNTFSCPDDDREEAKKVVTFNIDIKNANINDFINGAAIEVSTSQYPLKPTGVMKRQ
jgi:hypothetical protein